LIVGVDGTSRVQTRGFPGRSCKEVSHFLERALGQKQKEQLTAEFYEQNVSQSQQASEGS
jgi:glycine/serine hydroxymethyltransferase